ncbi:RlpA-like domain superfamily [Sesbania bispinosa]|nr:RlpA-like domain superfamily [Sesbania bispinosa]
MQRIKICSISFQTILFLLILVPSFWLNIDAATCKPNEKIREKRSHCSKEKVPSHGTKAVLTLNSFEKGGDGGGPSECDGKFHSDNTLIVALSTRWYNHGKRCHHKINIFGNGRRVSVVVVDECDSTRGCHNNIVDASKAVWEALGVPKKDWGELDVFWSDA